MKIFMEQLFAPVDEYETSVAQKQYRSNKKNTANQNNQRYRYTRNNNEMSCFIDTLDCKFLTQIKWYSSECKFKFGGGQVLKSLFYVEIQILLAGENVLTKFDVVDRDLPLLEKKNKK